MLVGYKGKQYRVRKSKKKGKQMAAELPGGDMVHFGDPDMPEFPGTKRGDNYCARSYGLGKQHNLLGDPTSANFWSRKFLWNCKGKKSMSSKQKASLNILR